MSDFCFGLSGLFSSSILILLTAVVSDFTTTALIGIPITLSFLVVIISTVAVIPGLNGENVSGFPSSKSWYDSFIILIFTLKLVT